MSRDAWRIASATAIGTSHLNTGTVCQDSVLHKVLRTLSGDVLVAVVSDGAGSALYSDVGSRVATETLVELVEIALAANKQVSELTREIALEWLQAINIRLNEIATANEHIVRDYACTLLAAIIAPDVAAYLQIGDGAIVVSENEADGWSYIFWPQHGEYANSTNFVVSPDAAEALAFEVGPGHINEVAIFSDGLENLVLHNATKTVHEAFFSAMLPPVRALLADGLDSKLSAGLPPEVCDAAGNVIALGAEVGQGGEGIVFDVRSSTDTVAKIYHQPLSTERTSKIRLMASLRSDEISRLTAWPTGLLSTKQGQRPIGLLMPKVFGKKDIHRLYSVKSRRTDFQRVDWRFLIRAASNTARAFGAVHKMNCVIGDVNHGSILVGLDATVKLIDCDSFQIISGSQRYLCGVGVDTFTPPELQGHLRRCRAHPQPRQFWPRRHDFSSAVHGEAFAGLYTGGDMPIAKAIGEYRFAYGSKSKQYGMSRPPGAASLAIAGPEVSQLFERAFSREGAVGGRPTAREWADALERLEADLKQCTANSSHWFRTGGECPWCPIEGSTGISLFSLVVQTAAGASFEIEALWRQANAIPNPGTAPALGIPLIVPSAEALSAHQARRNSKLVAAAIGLALAGIGIFGGLDSPLLFGWSSPVSLPISSFRR